MSDTPSAFLLAVGILAYGPSTLRYGGLLTALLSHIITRLYAYDSGYAVSPF